MTILDEIKECIAYQLSYWEDEPSAIHMSLSARMVSGDGKVEEMAEVPLITCKDCKHYSEHEWVIIADVSDVCHFWHGRPTKVKSDGFCAWAERRDA